MKAPLPADCSIILWAITSFPVLMLASTTSNTSGFSFQKDCKKTSAHSVDGERAITPYTCVIALEYSGEYRGSGYIAVSPCAAVAKAPEMPDGSDPLSIKPSKYSVGISSLNVFHGSDHNTI